MADVLNDAAQALAKAMSLGQERLEQMLSAAPADTSGTPDWMDMMKHYSQLQQNFAAEVVRVWTSMSGLAGLPGASDEHQARQDDGEGADRARQHGAPPCPMLPPGSWLYRCREAFPRTGVPFFLATRTGSGAPVLASR